MQGVPRYLIEERILAGATNYWAKIKAEQTQKPKKEKEKKQQKRDKTAKEKEENIQKSQNNGARFSKFHRFILIFYLEMAENQKILNKADLSSQISFNQPISFNFMQNAQKPGFHINKPNKTESGGNVFGFESASK